MENMLAAMLMTNGRFCSLQRSKLRIHAKTHMKNTVAPRNPNGISQSTASREYSAYILQAQYIRMMTKAVKRVEYKHLSFAVDIFLIS